MNRCCNGNSGEHGGVIITYDLQRVPVISRSGLERVGSLRREPVVGFGICLDADDRVGERRDSEDGGDERNCSDVPFPRTAGCDRERLLPDDIDLWRLWI